jgi:hypothetical protein
MAIPLRPKIYHICHVDRLASIVASGGLLSDAAILSARLAGTVIGMNHIKQRRLQELALASHPQLFVGQCVPFYFCPRSFTLSNAGARYFEDRANLAQLDEIDWEAVNARDWRQCKEGKQAEFLLEHDFPWQLVEQIGVHSRPVYGQVANALPAQGHRPRLEIEPGWYY